MHATDTEQKKWLNNLKFHFVKLVHWFQVVSPVDRDFIQVTLRLSTLALTKKEYQKATKTVRGRQLQRLEKTAIKPEPVDISTTGSWNIGEGTSHSPEYNQLTPWEKLRRCPIGKPDSH